MLFFATGVGETQIDEFHVIVFDHLQGFYGHLKSPGFSVIKC
jgi:hypothetical protein